VNSIFVLRALAAPKLLHQSEFLRRCAAAKPVIHTHCSGCEAEKRGQKWLGTRYRQLRLLL
jgi:hypothetical protein